MDQTTVRKAYKEGLKLKDSGLGGEEIYARLEKMGIPPELANEVTSNVLQERTKEEVSNEKVNLNVALIRIGIGVAVAVIAYLIKPGNLFLPLGFIAAGIVAAVIAQNNIDKFS